MGSLEDAILPGPLEAVKHVSAITGLQKVILPLGPFQHLIQKELIARSATITSN